VIAGILLGIATGLLANEFCAFSPWCAGKLVRWSAFRRYADRDRAEMRAEELTALVNDRPGNLFKVITAACFATSAVIVSARRAIAREPGADTGRVPTLPTVHDQVQALTYDYLDGKLDDLGCATVRGHLDECGPCLREYGLEEAVKRLVAKHCDCDPAPADLRAKILVRIREVRATLDFPE
jgi:mycothiol system anti-sigma-R factor